MEIQRLAGNIDALVDQWMPERSERMARTALARADFDALADAGLALTGVPADMGGLWESKEQSVRPVAAALRKLATVDPSLGLVCAMHPTVLMMWLNGPAKGGPDGWAKQRNMVFDAARAGLWFGTIASEPGIGGDFMATKAVAKPDGGDLWRLSGDKYMGSGSGITSFMMTVARPDGETQPDIFLIDTRGLAWDGSQGLKMTREWDGIGMAATQSHAFRFNDVPVYRHGLQGGAFDLLPLNSPIIGFIFSSVFVGILDAAADEAKRLLTGKAQRLSAFEQTSWMQGLNQVWLANQALEGMAHALETGNGGLDVLHGKLAIADLAEQALMHLSHAVGGVSMSRANPFGQWMQDVRALGNLRPPRALTYAKLLEELTAG